MAGIHAISISGIRSFGPEESDQQTIYFSKPLTLILGQNGCGKTTIIESLKYGITGQFPPGSKNECFVYDAKVNKTQEVLGQVKLIAVNTKGNKITVSRSMQVTSKGTKSQFKTLDSSISRIDPKTEKLIEISSRCADIDQLMYEELGVSKAILNSVIFCHQEDSAWPLDEGKKVKERFDEIFDADKYSSCLDRLTKIYKEYGVQIKLSEQNVLHLSEKKADLDRKKLDIINTEARIADTELKLMEIDKKTRPISEKLRSIETIEKNLVQFETKKENAKLKLENCFSQQTDLRKNIENVFEGSTDQLQSDISGYECLMNNKQQELEDLKKQLSRANLEEKNVSNQISQVDINCNKLVLLESQNQERIDSRNQYVLEAIADINIDKPNEIETENEAMELFDKLKKHGESNKMDLLRAQHEAEATEKKLQVLVNESRDKLSMQKQIILSKESEVKEMVKVIKKLESDIADAEQSKEKLNKLEKSLHLIEEEYTKLCEEMSVDQVQEELNTKEKELESAENELDTISKLIDKLQSQRAKLTEINLTENNLKVKEKMLDTLINKHKSNLMELLSVMPESRFAMAVSDVELSLNSDVQKTKKTLKQKEHEKTALETNQQHTRDLIKSKKNELSICEDQIFKSCKSQSYDVVLTKVDSELNKLQEEKEILSSSQSVIGKYKKQLEQDHNCPLCSRSFDDPSEISELISSLTMTIKNVPMQLEKVSEQLSKVSAQRDELLALKSVHAKVIQLKEVEIPKLEIKLKAMEENLLKVLSEEEELSMTLMEPEQKLQLAKQLAIEMPLLDRCSLEVKTLHKDLAKLKAQCTDVDGSIDYEETVTKQSVLRQSVLNLRNNIKKTQTKLNQHLKKTQALADKKNKLKDEYLNLKRKVQDICNLQEKLQEAKNSKLKLDHDIQGSKQLTISLEKELNTQERNKNRDMKEIKNNIESKRNKLDSIKNAVDKISSIQKDITQHLKRNIPEQISKMTSKHSELLSVKNELSLLAKKHQEGIDSLIKEISQQELFKRELDDNLKLRQLEDQAIKLQKELDNIITSMGGIDSSMISCKKELIKQQAILFSENGKLQGSIQEMKNTLKCAKHELQQPHNRNIEDKYREKFSELQIIKAMQKDIKDYSSAMDKCLMQYHKEKMENINLIIREMWHKIYRGNDIDYIKIKTEGATVNETKATTRRKYEYRVVQCKNGVEIDMRGRCSAGQKVLACLIIRLALAETFSTRFGVLALDEPTTNLDQENITSLCSALADIVNERMRQKNFMFIIITHDREFIDTLGSIDKVSHFYEVSRNHEGKSRVKKEKFTV